MEAYSVLMSVYYKADPAHFATAIQSMIDQTVKTNDFVIVCDGALTRELDEVIAEYTHKYPDLFQIVHLPENQGIGAAAHAGLQQCRNDLVAKMDADDISVADRCAMQLELFQKNPRLTVVGGYIEEFEENPEKPFAIRSVPETNTEICQFARRRQPFNNVSVMYRRSAVLAVGGYRNFRRYEDYDLYIRLLHAGYQAENLTKVLVKARVSNGALSRRASWHALTDCVRCRWYALRIGFSSLADFLYCIVGQIVIFISPAGLRQFIYQKFLRQKADRADSDALRAE